jgi:hypothetical protein
MKGCFRSLHNEELHEFYADEIGGACRMHGSDKKCIQNFHLKPERKKPVGRSRRR